MADAKTNYLERKLLDHALGTTTYTKPTNVYASLHSANPTDAGSGGEISGGSYARKVLAFTAAATVSDVSSASNSADIVWTNLPSVTITHIAIWDASTSGNMLYYAPLSASKVISSGDGYTIATGQLAVTEQ